MNAIAVFVSFTAVLCLLSCSDSNRAMESYHAGNGHFAKREFKEALEKYREALGEDGGLSNARLMVAKVYYYEKKFNRALEELDDLLDVDPGHVGALYWKARTLAVSNSALDNEAISLLIKVVERDGSHVRARSLLALLYEKNQKYREAIAEYAHILQEEESIISARGNASVLYFRLGLNDRATEEIDRAIGVAKLTGHESDNLESIKREMKK